MIKYSSFLLAFPKPYILDNGTVELIIILFVELAIMFELLVAVQVMELTPNVCIELYVVTVAFERVLFLHVTIPDDNPNSTLYNKLLFQKS